MAEDKLRQALQAIAAAQAASPGTFQDEAGDALKACRTAFLQCRSSPELLDTLQDPPEMANTLGFLLLSCEKKPSRKGQVRECLKILLERPRWLNAAHTHEDKKNAILEFSQAFPDMADIVEALQAEEAPAIADPVKKEKRASQSEPAGDAGETSADELTRRLLLDGLEIMREVDFQWPSGVHSEEKSDRAHDGFASLYKGTTRLRDEGLLKCITDSDMAQILSFLTSTYQCRSLLKAKVLFVVDKLMQFSEEFQKAVSEARLPWAAKETSAAAKPAAPAKRESPRLPLAAPAEAPSMAFRTAESEAAATGYSADRSLPVPNSPTSPIPVMSVLLPSARRTVVWLDGRELMTDDKATILKDAEISVAGFHDNWRLGESRAAEEALTYIVNAISSPDESISGVVVNNGPSHKQMLKDVRRFCATQGRDPPFAAACTMRGTHADFADCGGVDVIDRDRVAVQQAIVEHVMKQ